MKTEPLPLETALDHAAACHSDGASRFPWAMIQTYSRLYLGVNPLTDTEKSTAEDWKSFFQDKEQWKLSLLEARFFSEAEEIRLFRQDRDYHAVLIAEEGELYLEETCEIANEKKFGGSVTVRRVIGFDDDGQAQIVLTRLSGWKEAEVRG